jgi:hypothetical protein
MLEPMNVPRKRNDQSKPYILKMRIGWHRYGSLDGLFSNHWLTSDHDVDQLTGELILYILREPLKHKDAEDVEHADEEAPLALS